MEYDYAKGAFKEDLVPVAEHVPDPWFDDTMAKLRLITARAQEDNLMLKGMIDELQKDWTEDEKLQVNDAKEWQRQQKLKEQNKEPEMPKELTTEAIDCLKECKVEGLVVKLPEAQLDRKVYMEVKGRLELIGGKWKGGKVGGFVFQEDPTALLAEIADGGTRNIKKEFQFFATPDALADDLVEYAYAGRAVNDEPDMILEPSAGQGAIVKAMNRKTGGNDVYCYELMELNRSILGKISTVRLLGNDFLAHEGESFDLIIANPPFSKNQDIDHIRKMYECLENGGRVVSIASKHWQNSTGKKESAFSEWLKSLGAEVHEIPAGAFKESGTNISACIIIIDKL